MTEYLSDEYGELLSEIFFLILMLLTKKADEHSPYEFGMKLLPKKLVEALGLELIPADKVILKPELLN